jgi:hypothetical protein
VTDDLACRHGSLVTCRQCLNNAVDMEAILAAREEAEEES